MEAPDRPQFQKVIRDLSIQEREPTIEERAFRVSDTPPFPWSRETVDAEHTVFNLTPVDNRFEARFARFLDRAGDVAGFAKLTMNSRFALEYVSTTGALRYYYPDFVLRLVDDTCLVVETKGLEDLDVALKDRRARRWCRDASALSGRDWAYEKVRQKVFDAYTGDDVDGLRRFVMRERLERPMKGGARRGARMSRRALRSVWERMDFARR